MVKIYVGYDPRDELAFRACVSSIRKHTSGDVQIIPLKDHELRRAGVYWRAYFTEYSGQKIDQRDGKPFSTDFSFTRFAIPLIDESDEWVLFCDADMLFMSDVKELFKLADNRKHVMCVQHDYTPKETTKFDGMRQEQYNRKNWSSLMLMRPARCAITPYVLNNATGSQLHAMIWESDDEIGALPESWNWLEGWSSLDIKPDIVHYTRGTPDMIGNDLPFAEEWWEAVEVWQPWMNENGLFQKKMERQ